MSLFHRLLLLLFLEIWAALLQQPKVGQGFEGREEKKSPSEIKEMECKTSFLRKIIASKTKQNKKTLLLPFFQRLFDMHAV